MVHRYAVRSGFGRGCLRWDLIWFLQDSGNIFLARLERPTDECFRIPHRHGRGEWGLASDLDLLLFDDAFDRLRLIFQIGDGLVVTQGTTLSGCRRLSRRYACA